MRFGQSTLLWMLCAVTASACAANPSPGVDAACGVPGAAVCAAGTFCETPPGACGTGAGECVAIPQACTLQYDPVCGCDGVTYGNDCQRRGAGVSLLHTGECRGVTGRAEPRTEHTWRLVEGSEPAPATLDDAAWLAGSWVGTAFGKRFEEVWNPPSAGSMVGMFKLYDDTGVAFYELLLLTEVDGTLSLQVKHFSDEFVAWEDKEDRVEFRLVAVEPNALHFGGISFYRRGADAIDGYIVMRNADEVTEHHLDYRRSGTEP